MNRNTNSKQQQPPASKKAQKKAAKKVVKAMKNMSIAPKSVAQSANPGKRAAKNALAALANRNSQAGLMVKEQILILLSVMSPKDFLSQRLGSQLGSYQTAVANTFNTFTAGWVDLDLPITSSISGPLAACYVFRDPFRFSVSPVANPSTTTTYEYRCSLDGTVQYNAVGAPLVFGRLAWFSGNKLHGDYLYPGKLSTGSRTYVWCDATSVVNIINGSAVSIAALPYFYRADGQISRGTSVVITAASTGSFTVGAVDSQGIGCYVGFDLSTTSGTQVLVGIQISVNSQSQAGIWYSHRSLPWIDSNIASIDACKVYGASLMLTNEASPLNRQGKLAAAQISEGRDWRQFTNYQSITAIKDSYINNIVNGYYGFLKPTQPKDLDFRDQSNTASATNTNTQAWFLLDNPSDFLACVAVVTDLNGRDAYFTVSAAVEYRTEDQFREVDPPIAPYDVVFQAMNMICQAPQHHENPFHISDIFEWLGEQFSGLWRGIKDAYPTVMEGLNTAVKVGTLAAPLLAL